LRIIVLLLSIATIVLYGYALAGVGGFLIGKGRLDYIIWGLTGGTGTAVAALWIWKRSLHLYFKDES
jgi:hypothetical protein